MHQLDTVKKAIAELRAANRMDAVPAVLKHYLMDSAYVNNTERGPLLLELNRELGAKHSVSFIKKANPALLETLEFTLPEKEQLIAVDGLKGEVNLNLKPASNDTAEQIPHSLNNETATMNTTTVTIEEGNNTAANAQATSGVKKVKVKTQDSHDAGFESVLAKAIKKGSGKKSDHVKFDMLSKGLNKVILAEFYVFIKDSMKKMIAGLKEQDTLKTAAQREEVFNAWIASDKSLKKEYKAFMKAADGQFEKSDQIIGMFLVTSSSNVKNLADFVTFAMDYKPSKSDGYSFLRENDNSIRSGWCAVGSAVILGSLDQVQRGFTVGSIAGTFVGAGLSFFAAEQLDEHISNTFLRTAAAAALGGAMGVGGSRLGSYLVDVPVYPGRNPVVLDDDDATVVATVPASTDSDSNEGGSILSRIPGLGGLFGA